MRRMWFATGIVLALVATACTGGGGGNATGSSSSGGVVNVVFWHPYGSGAEKNSLEDAVNEFNKTHPAIHVTPQFYGNSDHALEKVETAIAGGAYPDIAYLYGSWAANIATSPKTLVLNSYIQNDPSMKWNDFWPAERFAATVNRKIIGVPALVDNLAIVYNKKLFDQAGLSYPSADWTWDDFRNAAKQLTDPSKKQFGWVLPADGGEDTVWHWEAMLWEAGGDILNADNTQAVFNSPQGIQAMTMLQEMAQTDHSIYPDTSDSKYADLFNSGKIGMVVTGPWDLPSFPNIDYGVQIMPSFGDPSNHQTISGPDNWVLFDNGPARSKAAFEFISWYTSPREDIAISLQTSHLLIRASELKLPQYKSFIDKFEGISTFQENEQNAVKARPVTPLYPKVSAALGTAIVEVLLGKADAKTALDQAAQQANAALAAGA